ncbi:MAG: homoserine kinase [Acidobacteriota bacterium]
MKVSAFAPGSVSNIACGFDCLGFAVDGPGDLVTAEPKDSPGVEILEISGDGGRLPLEADRNTAGVAVTALLRAVGREEAGVALRIEKRMPLSSGLGSSAASAVAGARAAAELLGLEATRHQLLKAALEGERVACGSAHPDNATPSLYGGFVLIRSMEPLDIVELPVPEGLTCALVRPHVDVETRAARGALGDTLALATAVRQWANLGSLVAGLYRGDLELVSRSLVDHVAEPKRAHLVPGFREIQAAAVASGALGCSLSGSGPSIFALCGSPEDAERVAGAMVAAVDGPVDRLVSPVGAPGVAVMAAA